MTQPPTAQTRKKIFICFGIMMPVALLHFFTGPRYAGPFPDFVNGYLIDILLPFAVYFLLTIPNSPLIGKWWIRAGIVFMIGATVETSQYFGVPIFGQTFDPLDYVMYAMGVLPAVVCDRFVFPRLFTFWATA